MCRVSINVPLWSFGVATLWRKALQFRHAKIQRVPAVYTACVLALYNGSQSVCHMKKEGVVWRGNLGNRKDLVGVYITTKILRSHARSGAHCTHNFIELRCPAHLRNFDHKRPQYQHALDIKLVR